MKPVDWEGKGEKRKEQILLTVILCLQESIVYAYSVCVCVCFALLFCVAIVTHFKAW